MGMEDILKQHLDDLYGDWTMTPKGECANKQYYLTDHQLYQIQHTNWMHEDRAETQADIADAIGVSVHEFQKTTAGCY